MHKSPQALKKIIFALCYLIVIALSIKSFREPDLWWQIRTGQWILEHHQVPHQDVFSYTMQGTEWINIKWGFEVLAATVSNLLGVESVFLIQSVVNCLLLFFLLKLSALFIRRKNPDGVTTSAYLFSAVVALLFLFIASEYRMNGRPEMISHLMTVVFLFILERHRQSPSPKESLKESFVTLRTKQIYWLIPLQMLWANLHEAFGIGIVILLIYAITAPPSAKGGRWLSRVSPLLIVTGLSIAAILINPNGFKLLTRPFNILGQIYENKYTTELLNFSTHAWWQKEAYLGLFIFIVSIVGFTNYKLRFTNERTNLANLKSEIINRKFSYILVLLAFLFLALTAYRNIIFLCLACFPAFHASLFTVFDKLFKRLPRLSKLSTPISVVLLLGFYVLIVSNKYYSLTKSRDRFGLEVLSNFNPVGAGDYIQKVNPPLIGKKCFSDYLTSSYLLWKLQPTFTTFIDLRDLDVFPQRLFDKFLDAVNFPTEFYRLDSAENFQYVVLYQSQFSALHAYLYNDSIYALKYVDPVAAVYEKTDDFSREDIFSSCQPVRAGTIATAVNKILNPFYHPFDYSTVDNDYIAATYYINTGRLSLAEKRAEACTENPKNSYKGYELLGRISFYNAMRENDRDKKGSYLEASEQYYYESLRFKKDYAPSLLGLAGILLTRQNYTAALNQVKKCLDKDDSNMEAHLFSAECYKAMLNQKPDPSHEKEYLQQMLDHYLEANSLNPGNAAIEANIGFAYARLDNCRKAKKYLVKLVGIKSLNEEDNYLVKEYLKKCE